MWRLNLGLAALLSMSASATDIYNNSTNDLSIRFNPGALQVGDEINLVQQPMFRNITNFSFEYYGLASGATFAGAVQARIRFYENNGLPVNGFVTPL